VSGQVRLAHAVRQFVKYGGMPALLETDEIIDCIDSRLRKYVCDVRFRPSDEAILLYVSREKVSDKARSGFTSDRQMENLKKRLKEKFSKDVEIIYTLWETHQGLEDAFHQMLNHRFTGRVLSFYMSFINKNTVNSWIEVAEPYGEIKEEIEKRYLRILEDAGLLSGFIQWIDSSSDLPTLPWLLRFLKIRQPIDLKNVAEVASEEFPAISEKWLSHKLDQLRKKNLVIREKTGSYVLTSKALSTVPAGAKYTSSDIDRALDLGRRKW